MDIAVIIDILLAVALLAFLVSGLVRGLFRTLAGLLVLIVALVGASFAAQQLAPVAAAALQPKVESYIEKRVDQALTGEVTPVAPEIDAPDTPTPPSDLGIPEDLSVAEQAVRILEALGFGESTREKFVQRAEELVRDTSVSVVSAVTDSLLQSVLYTVIFLLAFTALTLVLRLLVKALDLVLQLPGLHLLNALGGGLLGLIQGVLVLFLAFWLADRFNLRFSAQTIGDTWLLQFFVTNGPLGFLSPL